MRIFQVITVSEYGGAQTIVANLIETLSPEHEVFVLYGGDGEAWSMLKPNFKKIKLNDHRKKISWRDLLLLFKLFYYRFKYKPDIIHLHSSKMGVLGRIAFNPQKIIYTVHGFDSIRTAFPQYLSVEKTLKNRASRIVGVSQYDVNLMQEEGICKNVSCIYNGVRDHFLENKDLRDPITEELQQIKLEYPKIVMCISRISKQKKFDLFVEVAKEMPEYAFVWIGNKRGVENLPSNVFCLGETHSAFVYLSYADIFILPSNYEGLPMSLLEALSFGIPVVASAVGGISEVLNGTNGFAVENEVDLFKEKIDYILSSDTIRQSISSEARKTYLAHFTIDKMTTKYMATFSSIVSPKKEIG